MNAWNPLILEAETPEALVRLARDYVASLSPAEWAALPPACRPGKIQDPGDIAYWQSQLVGEYCTRAAIHGRESELLSAMLGFFTAAARRADVLAELPHRAQSLFSDNSRPALFSRQS